MNLGMTECRLPPLGHCLNTLTSDLVSRVCIESGACISPIFFEVGIPNLVCECILGQGSVAYHFRVTVTLTSDLVFRIIVP